MSDEAWLNPNKGPADDEVAFDYVKAPDFRVVWADGAMGSLTPNGLVHFSLYAERPALPRRQVFKIDSDTGLLSSEVPEKLISRGSIVREMSCDILMSPIVAESLANWLLDRVKEQKQVQKGK